MSKKNKLVVTASLIFLVGGCAGKATDTDLIQDAQNCLDTAKTTEATACVAKVDGITTQAADLIRCVGKFVKEGYNDSSKVSTARESLKTSGNGATGSLGMMAALAFKSESTSALNSARAQDAFTLCTKANSKGLILLSGLVQTATVLGDLSSSLSNMTASDLAAAMGTYANNPTAQAAVGSAVVAMYNSNCTSGQTATGNYCTQFSSAVTASGGTTNSSAIGQLVMTCYNNPAATGCSGY